MGDMQKTIRFPDELAQKIQAIAEAEDRTFSYVVVRAMERALGDAEGDRIPERPAPPRSTSPKKGNRTIASMDPVLKQPRTFPKPSAALARQQALNKPKGI